MTQTFHGLLEDMGVNGPTLKQYLYDNWRAIVTQWAGENPPDNPYSGQPWLDISEGWSKALLKMWNGTNWVETSKNSTVNNDVELARGSKDTLWERLEVALNEDGTLKSSQAENMTEWVDSALVATYVSTTEFSVEGDQTDIFVENRKIKATLDSSIIYSVISASSYVSITDITTITLEDEVLDDGLRKVEYGLIKPGDNGSMPDSVNNAVNAARLENKTLSNVFDMLHPIGSIYVNSVDDTNPGDFPGWQGTWEKFGKGKVLVGQDPNDTDFDTAGETGGEKTHTLTENEMSSHNHSGSTSANGNHNHNVRLKVEGSGAGRGFLDTSSGSAKYTTGYHTEYNKGNHNHSFTTNSSGGDQSHNNLQPYIIVHMWVRTA